MEEDRSSAVEEDEEDMSEDDSLALPCGTPVWTKSYQLREVICHRFDV